MNVFLTCVHFAAQLVDGAGSECLHRHIPPGRLGQPLSAGGLQLGGKHHWTLSHCTSVKVNPMSGKAPAQAHDILFCSLNRPDKPS